MHPKAFPYRLFFLAIFCIAGIQNVQATHLRAGEITVTRESCGSLIFRITITVYTNTGSPIRFSNSGLGELNFGDGSAIFHPPQKENSPVPGFGPEFGFVTYSVEHTYSGNGEFVISYSEHNRNASILNMTSSVDTPFYIETKIIIDPALGCDNTPQLLVPPIDKACIGAVWFHNPGAYDPDGDSISFMMTTPRQAAGLNVLNYLAPNTEQFYTTGGLIYDLANEAHTGPPTFSINPVEGMVTWDAPGAPGQYTIAFQIIEWRKISGTWTQLGYVTRDMQIIVEDCNNRRPELTVPADGCVVAGTTITKDIFATDPDNDSVRIEGFSELFTLASPPASLSPDPPIFQLPTPNPAVAHFSWNTECENIAQQPYQVVFKVTDKAPPAKGAVLVGFKTWNIRVAGPPPVLTTVQAQSGRKANLTWETYSCTNAASMQVWRRTGSYPYDPTECVIGMPGFLGFTKVAEVPVTTLQYLDTNNGIGLAPGAEYCYRLVAVFAAPDGGESYMSAEHCITVAADVALITKVSIDKTDQTSGQTTINWISPRPSDTNTNLFPPPYSYLLYRSDGLSGNTNQVQLFSTKTTDSVYIDNGLNTEENIYNYKVVAYSNGTSMVGTSASASSLRLNLTSTDRSIALQWNADVPWSNQTVAYPFHGILRGPEGSTQPGEMQWIDSVNVSEDLLHYIDSGKWNNTPLDKAQTYCYCVVSRGSYGNIDIFEPLVNLSQIACIKLTPETGELLPSPPTVSVYPNPSNNFLIIKGTTQEVGPTFAIDLVGRSTRLELEKEEDLLKADIRFLATGMYILRISDGNAVHQLKFIKQ